MHTLRSLIAKYLPGKLKMQANYTFCSNPATDCTRQTGSDAIKSNNLRWDKSKQTISTLFGSVTMRRVILVSFSIEQPISHRKVVVAAAAASTRHVFLLSQRGSSPAAPPLFSRWQVTSSCAHLALWKRPTGKEQSISDSERCRNKPICLSDPPFGWQRVRWANRCGQNNSADSRHS